MKDTPEGSGDRTGDLRSLRLLRWLVTVLMVVMIAGFILLIALLVTRFPARNAAPALPPVLPTDLPSSITLPDGAEAAAFTQGAGWYAIVTGDDRILVYDRRDGSLVQTVHIVLPD